MNRQMDIQNAEHNFSKNKNYTLQDKNSIKQQKWAEQTSKRKDKKKA